MKGVSVIIPCYKQAHYLAAAIESCLAQEYSPLEIIVVNDGSPDDTPAVVARYGDRIHYIAQENRGLSGARNTGIRAATKEYIAFLDSDDIYLPGSVAQLAGYLDQHTQIDLVCADAWLYDGVQKLGLKSAITGHPRHAENFRWETIEFCPTPSTVCVRRTALDQVEPFDEQLKNAAEDWLMWVNLSLVSNMAYIDAPLTLYRTHASNATKNVVGINAGNRYAVTKICASPQFTQYPADFRARLLYFRFAAAWRAEGKATAASYFLKALATSPRQIGYGVGILLQGVSNSLQRQRAT